MTRSKSRSVTPTPVPMLNTRLFGFSGDGREIDAERGVLVVDEVVLVVAALLELERKAVRGVLDDAAHHRHRSVARRLARPVGRGEAQRHGVEPHVVAVVDADVLAHELGRVVDPLRVLRHVLGHRLVGRRAVLADDRAVDALRAGEHDALDVERARGLQDVDQAQHVDLDAQRRVGRRDRAHEGRAVNDVGDLVLLDRLQDARHVENVAELDVHLVDDVADQALVAVAREDHRPMALLHELAAGLGADDAHAAGDQDLHARLRSPVSIDPMPGDEVFVEREAPAGRRATRRIVPFTNGGRLVTIWKKNGSAAGS